MKTHKQSTTINNKSNKNLKQIKHKKQIPRTKGRKQIWKPENKKTTETKHTK